MTILALLLIWLWIQLAVVFLVEYRRPERAISWIFLILIFPLFGLFLYAALEWPYRRRGIRLRRACEERKRAAGSETLPLRIITAPASGGTGNPGLDGCPELLGLLLRLCGNPVTRGSGSRVLPSAETAYDRMLEAIESAQEHIHLEMYIIRDDGSGKRFRSALIRKARQGVKVRLLLDGTGSRKLGRSFLDGLRAAGVKVHLFLPVALALPAGAVNYRNHRKILVVDGSIAFTGGLNIGDEYLGGDPKLGCWRDTFLEMTGDAVYASQRVFLRDWRIAAGEQLLHPRLFPPHGLKGGEAVQIVASGPDQDLQALPALLSAAFSVAKSRLWIATPYFVPDQALALQIKTAVLKGVDVRILLPGVADGKLVKYATLSKVEELLDAGVRFYRYRKGFLHAKVWIIDETAASVGSANLDMRSLYTNFELIALLFSPERIGELAEAFRQDLEDSEPIEPERFRQRPFKDRLKEEICGLLAPLL
ncbi:cardiolipin synthase [Paenibacillus glufosinatiresistens]|uniref:cardiolipin synthase n=1 Tax=Paenibacillus glufosinatiresistens TaxID=3070657 RepID=UPI00286D9380|nr:cardiolipin synthase [Paenibacillus sp. YX.27]